MLLEDHHGGSVDVDVVLAGQFLSASESNVHVAKGQVIPVGKGCQLGGRKSPAVFMSQRKHFVPQVPMVTLVQEQILLFKCYQMCCGRYKPFPSLTEPNFASP